MASSGQPPMLRHVGMVSVIGRPNVGKSTLVNALVGAKVSITSRKPQTTRFRVMGIHTTPDWQVVYIDTPGLQQRARRRLNRAMNQEVTRSLEGVDALLFVVAALEWRPADEAVLRAAVATGLPMVVAVNKIDRVRDKRQLLPFLAELGERVQAHALLPVSALRGEGLAELEQELLTLLPPGPPLFEGERLSDRGLRFMVAELVREKLMDMLGDELPYSIGVVVEALEHGDRLIRAAATIWVERRSQKPIIVGRGGAVLRRVGEQVRRELEQMTGCRVWLETWVKVRERWTDDPGALRELGFEG